MCCDNTLGKSFGKLFIAGKYSYNTMKTREFAAMAIMGMLIISPFVTPFSSNANIADNDDLSDLKVEAPDSLVVDPYHEATVEISFNNPERVTLDLVARWEGFRGQITLTKKVELKPYYPQWDVRHRFPIGYKGSTEMEVFLMEYDPSRADESFIELYVNGVKEKRIVVAPTIEILTEYRTSRGDRILRLNQTGEQSRTIGVKNNGGSREIQFTIDVYDSGWSVKGIPPLVLNSGESKNVELTIGHSDPQPGDNCTILLKAESSDLITKARIELRIAQDYGISLDPEVLKLNGPPMKTVETQLMVENTGNGTDIFYIGVKGEIASYVLNIPERVTVEGQDSETVTIEAKVPDGSPDTEISGTILVESKYSGKKKEVPITLTIDEELKIEITGDEPAGRLDETIVMDVTVSNNGNSGMSIELFFEGMGLEIMGIDGTVAPESKSIYLLKGEIRIIEVEASIITPYYQCYEVKDPERGNYRAEYLRVRAEYDGHEHLPSDLPVRVIPSPDFRYNWHTSIEIHHALFPYNIFVENIGDTSLEMMVEGAEGRWPLNPGENKTIECTGFTGEDPEFNAAYSFNITIAGFYDVDGEEREINASAEFVAIYMACHEITVDENELESSIDKDGNAILELILSNTGNMNETLEFSSSDPDVSVDGDLNLMEYGTTATVNLAFHWDSPSHGFKRFGLTVRYGDDDSIGIGVVLTKYPEELDITVGAHNVIREGGTTTGQLIVENNRDFPVFVREIRLGSIAWKNETLTPGNNSYSFALNVEPGSELDLTLNIPTKARMTESVTIGSKSSRGDYTYLIVAIIVAVIIAITMVLALWMKRKEDAEEEEGGEIGEKEEGGEIGEKEEGGEIGEKEEGGEIGEKEEGGEIGEKEEGGEIGEKEEDKTGYYL